jgi:transposase
MESVLRQLQEEVARLTAELRSLQTAHSALQAENTLLRNQNAFLKRQLFGKKSERLDRNQLELALRIEESAHVIESTPDDNDDPRGGPRRRRKGGERKVGIPDGTPVEEIVIDPEEVKANPSAYECIGEEVSRELDVVPSPYVLRVTRRRKYKNKSDRTQPPLVAPAPAKLIEGSLASPGLLADIILKKYVEHLPLHRQEQVLKSRYGITLSRKTMCDWIGSVADWLKPIYRQMREELRQETYLQVDETPVRYNGAEGGGSRKGYLWVYHHPGGSPLFEWHQGRGADCMKDMLDPFSGTLQIDGYIAYTSYAASREGLELAGCWAHTRRYFFEALEEAPKMARWFLHQIGLLYQVETDLRIRKAGPRLRQAVRSANSAMTLARIEKALHLLQPRFLLKSRMGTAIAYALGQGGRLMKYRDDGRIEIDNNLVENAIRPTAVGKKNWLFFGAPDAGERSAILYTILESCKRLGIHQETYLRDVLTRLPSMKISEVAQLTPTNWLAARKSKAA